MSLFISTLGQLGRRTFVAELDEKLAQLTQQVRHVGKPGKLVIELTLKPRNSEASEVDVIEDARVTAPKQPRKGSIFFTTEEGSLTRTDPNQTEMDLREVQGGIKDNEQPAADRKSAVS